jgi:hypothetical protein
MLLEGRDAVKYRYRSNRRWLFNSYFELMTYKGDHCAHVLTWLQNSVYTLDMIQICAATDDTIVPKIKIIS